MGSIYDSVWGLDNYYAVGLNYRGSSINSRPINGFDGSYYVDWTFSEREKENAKKALLIYFNWIKTPELKECAYNNGFFDGPGFQQDVNRVFESLGKDEANLFIYRYKDSKQNSGTGKSRLKVDVGYANKNSLLIGLNTNYMSNSYDIGENPAYWAGIILHQALHSRGYVHDSDLEEINYSSFPVEAGRCLQTLEQQRNQAPPRIEGSVRHIDNWANDFLVQ